MYQPGQFRRLLPARNQLLERCSQQHRLLSDRRKLYGQSNGDLDRRYGDREQLHVPAGRDGDYHGR